MTEEEEFEFRLRLESEAAPSPAPKEESFIDRSVDRLSLGVSDAMSTLAGDTYGRSDPTGSPLQRDNMNFPARLLKAAGGDILPAAGEIVADAAVEKTPQMVKSGLSKTLSAMQENKERHPIYGNASYVEGAKQLIDPLPSEIKETLGEAANVVGAVSAPKARFAEAAEDRLTQSMDALRRKDIRKKLEPQNIEDDANYGSVVEEGRLNTKRYIPSDIETRMDEEVFKIEGLDPRRSARHNTTEIEGKVDELRIDLDESLVGTPGVPITTVRARIDDAIAKAGESPTMVGDAEKSAKKIYAELDRLLLEVTSEADGVAPGDLLKVRRDLDSWIRSNTPKAFDPAVVGANQIATKEIRTSINTIINEAVPEAHVAESLRRQSDLLSARDSLTHERLREGKSGLSRSVSKVEGDTGLAAASTPLAFTANISSLPAMLVAGVATAASLGARGAVVAGMKLKASAMEAIQAAVNAGESAAILGILNSQDSYTEEETE